MQISIKYCVQWNYHPQAAGLAEAIKAALKVEPKLIEGAGGVFDVHVDGKQVWSKHDIGRFPEDSEVLDKIKALAPEGGKK